MLKRLIAVFWLIAIVLGAFHAWADRHAMTPDGICYLDMGDAYWRGDWNMAINAFWSPLYSWLLGLAMRLLKPSPYWEFSVVHLVNFVIYLCALGCFHFFLLELLHYHRLRSARVSRNGEVTLPEWALLALGYTLFIWSSLYMITIKFVFPSMWVAVFMYLAFGILLRIRREPASWLTFILLGVILGFGYLARESIFLFAFLFLGVSVFLVGNLRRAMPRVLIALVVFLSIASPLIMALSNAKGHLTFSDKGRLVYIWRIKNMIGIHWQGGDGTPKHATRKLYEKPGIYEFGTPIEGTYPVWYDPTYWYEGMVFHFDLREQARLLRTVVILHINKFFRIETDLLIAGVLIFYLMGWRQWVKDIAEQWSLLIPAISAVGMYSLLNFDPRHVGAFLAVLAMIIFSSVRLTDSQKSKRLVTWMVSTMVLTIMIPISVSTAPKAYSTLRDLIKGEDPTAHVQWQVANALKQIGVQSGDKVAHIGDSFLIYWARLARVQIIAEVPTWDVDKFWAADPSVKSQVIKILAGTGAKVIVAELVIFGKKVPHNYGSTIGWQRVGNTDYYVYNLK